MNAEQIKELSIERLKKEKIHYIEHLPRLYGTNEVKLRTQAEIAKRFIASILTTTMAFEIQNGTRDQNLEWLESMLKKFSIEKNFLTEKERELIYGNVGEQEVVNAVWKYESQWALFWVLWLVEEMWFPNTIADTDKMIHLCSNSENLDLFLEKVQLRSAEEILKEADIMYRYHWALVDQRANGSDAGELFMENPSLCESIIVERRAGLWWVIFSHDPEMSDWDDPDRNT